MDQNSAQSEVKKSPVDGNTFGNFAAVIAAILLVIAIAFQRFEIDSTAKVKEYRNSPETRRIIGIVTQTPSWSKGDQLNFAEVMNSLENDKLTHPLAAQMYVASQARLNQSIDPSVFKVATSVNDPFASAMQFLGGSQVGNRLSEREAKSIQSFRVGNMFDEYILRAINEKARAKEGLDVNTYLYRFSLDPVTTGIYLAGVIGLTVIWGRGGFRIESAHPMLMSPPRIGGGWGFLLGTLTIGFLLYIFDSFPPDIAREAYVAKPVLFALVVIAYTIIKRPKEVSANTFHPSLLILSGIGCAALAGWVAQVLTASTARTRTFTVPDYWLGGPIDIALSVLFLVAFPIAMTGVLNVGLRGMLERLKVQQGLGHFLAALPMAIYSPINFHGFIGMVIVGTISCVAMYRSQSLLVPIAMWAAIALSVF